MLILSFLDFCGLSREYENAEEENELSCMWTRDCGFDCNCVGFSDWMNDLKGLQRDKRTLQTGIAAFISCCLNL